MKGGGGHRHWLRIGAHRHGLALAQGEGGRSGRPDGATGAAGEEGAQRPVEGACHNTVSVDGVCFSCELSLILRNMLVLFYSALEDVATTILQLSEESFLKRLIFRIPVSLKVDGVYDYLQQAIQEFPVSSADLADLY